MPNRLAGERSPYLLQHANNPVDWYPWGDEAFERARREDKPSSCRSATRRVTGVTSWSTSRSRIRRWPRSLNAHFVSVKVDREERPDIDRVYMMFVQATTGAGGWPMSVWLTPDLKPFFGGTYFPPTSRWGRPGFVDILEQLGRAWKTERLELVRSAEDIIDRLRESSGADQAAPDRAPVAGRDALDDRRSKRSPRPTTAATAALAARRSFHARRADLSPARTRTDRRLASRHDGARHAARDVDRRHARPHRRRLPSLLGRRPVAGAAFREDAVRPGATRAGVSRGIAGEWR